MDRFNPLDHPIAFTYPLRNSPIRDWWGHVPFATTLVDLLRPATLVELGVYRGDSFSAFCQAVMMLSLPTKCTGIDAWIGDENTGPQAEEDIKELFEFISKRYSFATLLKSYFDDAVGSFAPDSINLLHIDGCHRLEAVRSDFAQWLPKLAPEGIILFHDIAIGGHVSVGVDIFWRELKLLYPGAFFEFAHSWGLGVLAPKGVPASLASLFASVGTPDESLIQTYFQLQGARNHALMIYRQTHGDYLMLQAINDPVLSSDPRMNSSLDPGVQFTL